MNGQEKSPVSESLATDENRLGLSLADRLERYACGKKRALDMTNYITERCGGKKKKRGGRLKICDLSQR